ncbi:fibronectin type III domain-containing protein [Lachnospiraceae bacterium ZAX-1]
MRTRSIYAKILSLLLSAVIVMATVPLFAMKADAAASGINVETHTQAEIKAYIKSNGAKVEDPTTYGTKPKTSAPYSAGTLTLGSLKSALNMLNQMRYIAGIDDDVTLNTDYNKQAQAAALLNYVNDTLSHTPAKPSGISNGLYQLGYEGASHSNIAYAASSANMPGYHTLNQRMVKGWMEDGDASNISRVGHRRWVLNPAMAQTGFGMVAGQLDWYTSYYAMYALDTRRASTYQGVAWPAQNMPVEYFGSIYPWTVSLGTPVDIDKAKVTLKRKSDGKTWTFSKNKTTDGYFNVDNSGYGATGCIIFRPNNITYAHGDTFDVSISGISSAVSYTVNFFSIADGSSDTDTNTKTTYAKTYKKAATDKAFTVKTTLTAGGTKPTYTSSNTKVATIDKNNGKVTMKGPGYTIITVKIAKTGTTKAKSEKILITVKPKKQAIKDVSAVKDGRLTVQWTKDTKATGYQMQYSTDKHFKKGVTSVPISKKATTSKSITKLTEGKIYYVRVRAYKNVKLDGKNTKLYSAWSVAKNVRAK